MSARYSAEVLWSEVARRCEGHGYMAGVERTVERVRATGEVFTPTALVIEMIRELPLDQFAPGRTILDPACGDGQFLVAAKWVKVLAHGMSESDAVADLYGIDIMRDNVDLCLRRLGGGTIVMGNTLKPFDEIEGQTEQERSLMATLFADGPFDRPVKKRPFHPRKPRQRHLDDPGVLDFGL
jgi:SAM-dependent methyltransferase